MSRVEMCLQRRERLGVLYDFGVRFVQSLASIIKALALTNRSAARSCIIE